jgi:outer membrane protein assembly factor BamB
MTAQDSPPKSRAALWLAALLLPPVGLVVLWFRPLGIFRKLLGSLALVGLSLFYLVYFFGLRWELSGSGMAPVFYFGDDESSYATLEKHRTEQRPAPRSTASGHAPWPRYRGPEGDGIYEEMAIRTDWPPSGPPELWKQPVGGGYASFVVAEGLAITIEQRRDQEVVAAYELRSGREVWTHGWDTRFAEAMGGDGPRATPTWDEGRLYALGAMGELRVLVAASGELLWRTNILEDAETVNLYYGQSSSPLIVDDSVILQPGGTGEAGSLLTAYDKRSGEILWKSPVTDAGGYTSPERVTLAGESQFLVISSASVEGLAENGGAQLWQYPWVTEYDINAAQALVLDDHRFFISSGYGHGAALLEVVAEGEGFKTRAVWENTAMKNRFASSVLYEGHVYGLDERIMVCLDAETGERRWKGGRYGYGQLLLAGGHVIVLTEKGEVALVAATPEAHMELARFTAIRGKTWNVPAIGDGVLLVRNARQMAAYDIAGP